MKYIKPYLEAKQEKKYYELNQDDVQQFLLSGDEKNIQIAHKRIRQIFRRNASYRYEISDDGLVNVYPKKTSKVNFDKSMDNQGNVARFAIFEYFSWIDKRLPLKFGVCYGSFDCTGIDLTSLEGSPSYVAGNFLCYDNHLTNLKGSPKKVDGSFYCEDNDLTTLVGGPEVVRYEYDCGKNRLVDLQGAPNRLVRLLADDNRLTTMKGCPQEIEVLDCNANKITSLEGSPKNVIFFACTNNPLKNLIGSPKTFQYMFFPWKSCLPKVLHSLFAEYDDITWEMYIQNIREGRETLSRLNLESVTASIISWENVFTPEDNEILRKVRLFLSSHDEFEVWNASGKVNMRNLNLMMQWINN